MVFSYSCLKIIESSCFKEFRRAKTHRTKIYFGLLMYAFLKFVYSVYSIFVFKQNFLIRSVTWKVKWMLVAVFGLHVSVCFNWHDLVSKDMNNLLHLNNLINLRRNLFKKIKSKLKFKKKTCFSRVTIKLSWMIKKESSKGVKVKYFLKCRHSTNNADDCGWLKPNVW